MSQPQLVTTVGAEGRGRRLLHVAGGIGLASVLLVGLAAWRTHAGGDSSSGTTVLRWAVVPAVRDGGAARGEPPISILLVDSQEAVATLTRGLESLVDGSRPAWDPRTLQVIAAPMDQSPPLDRVLAQFSQGSARLVDLRER